MNRSLALTFTILSLAIAGCQSHNASQKDRVLAASVSSPQVQKVTLPATEQVPAEITIEAPTHLANNVTVQVFHPDLNCENFLSEQVPVTPENSIQDAVGQTIERSINGDFALAGYRVNVSNGVAMVDFRLSPNSPRHFASLSQCEKFALFGSIRQTLTQNPQWKINEVRFTEQGNEIVL